MFYLTQRRPQFFLGLLAAHFPARRSGRFSDGIEDRPAARFPFFLSRHGSLYLLFAPEIH